MNNFRFQAFTVKDIVFLAVITAVTLLAAGPLAPIVMTVTKIGPQAFAMALPFALVTSIGLRKVKKAVLYSSSASSPVLSFY